MYYPYFRGKQFELLVIRENAKRMAGKISPIIEPVKQANSGLKKALEALIENDIHFVLICNPSCGDLAGGRGSVFDNDVLAILEDYGKWSLGCIVDENCTKEELLKNTDLHNDLSIIHNGYPRASALSRMLENIEAKITCHIFIEEACSKLYRRHFAHDKRILIRDGFIQRTNRDYPAVEHFSDLHITYEDEGVNGFGDYLIVGKEYSETGGPADAVAIHLTFINRAEDDDMFIKHYISDRSATPTDPAGKFAEALSKLVSDVNRRRTQIFHSDAVGEYIKLHERGHYPGLGYVKKLSMQHHIELLSEFMRSV